MFWTCGGCGRDDGLYWRAGPAEVIRGCSSIAVCSCLGFAARLNCVTKTSPPGEDCQKAAYVWRFKFAVVAVASREVVSLSSSFFLSDVAGSQTTQTWDFCKATEKVLSHPTLNIHKAFFEIGKAFRVTGVYGLFLSLPHTHTTSLSPFSEKLSGPIAMAYLLRIMGRSVPEDRLGWEERPEERRKWSRGRELCSVKTAVLGLRFPRSLL